MIISIWSFLINFFNTVNIISAEDFIFPAKRFLLKADSFLIDFHVTWMLRIDFCFDRIFFQTFCLFENLLKIRLRKSIVYISRSDRKFMITSFICPFAPMNTFTSTFLKILLTLFLCEEENRLIFKHNYWYLSILRDINNWSLSYWIKLWIWFQ